MKPYQRTIAGAALLILLALLALQWRQDAFVKACEDNGGIYAQGRCEQKRPPPILERDLKRS